MVLFCNSASKNALEITNDEDPDQTASHQILVALLLGPPCPNPEDFYGNQGLAIPTLHYVSDRNHAVSC